MKNIIILLLTAFVFSSCAIVMPKDPCGDPAKWEKRNKFHAAKRQWMKMRSDGYWLVYTTKGFAPTKLMVFECKPDSAQLANL